MTKRPAVLSPSAIERYRTCAQRFFLADIERRPRAEERGEALVVANATHHALELFFGLPEPQRLPANLERALRHVWPQHRKSSDFLSREHEAAVGRDALELVRRYATTFDIAVSPLARETRVSVTAAATVVVAGRIDRVDTVPGERAIELVDYKTGRVELDEAEMRWDPAIQLYVLGAERRFKRPVAAVRLQYLRSGAEVLLEIDDGVRTLLRDRLRASVEEIRTDTEWAATVATHCNWCPVEAHCEARRSVRLDELQPVEGMPF